MGTNGTKKAKDYFSNIDIKNEKVFFKKLQENLKKDEQWIYRGHSDCSWNLETTLERALKDFGGKKGRLAKKSYEEVESGLIRYFQIKSKNIEGINFPDRGDYPGWISLMQHYGAPTRFLDWTYSFPVACFFAVEKAKGQCSIWALSHEWLIGKARALFEKENRESDWKLLHERQKADKRKVFNSIFRGGKSVSFVYPLNPFYLNQRSSIQQSISLCPGKICRSFEENLYDMLKNYESELEKNCLHFRIPDDLELRKRILQMLIRNNVTRESLFPGLDGLGGSLRALLSKPEIIYPEPDYLCLVTGRIV